MSITSSMRSMIATDAVIDDASSQARYDGRTAALKRLGEYLMEWTFYRANLPQGVDIPFKIQKTYIDYADSEEEIKFPCVSFLPGDAEFLPIGLTPSLDEDTENLDDGTVTRLLWAYREVITVEVLCASKAERSAFMRDLPIVLSPLENIGGLRLTLPDYYNQTVKFSSLGQTTGNSPEEAKGRRTLRYKLQMDFDVVRRVHYDALQLGGTVLLRVADGSILSRDGKFVFEDREELTEGDFR